MISTVFQKTTKTRFQRKLSKRDVENRVKQHPLIEAEVLYLKFKFYKVAIYKFQGGI